jgi:uncharacterized membrane protein
MTDTPPKSPKSGRWIKWALFVSLALNLAVVGVVVGVGASHRSAEKRPEPSRIARSLGLGPYGDALTKGQMSDLRPLVAKRLPDIRKSRRSLRNGVSQTVQLLRADPFDADAFEAIMNAQGAAAFKLQETGRSILVERVKSMSPEDRAIFADRLENATKRGGGRGPDRQRNPNK